MPSGILKVGENCWCVAGCRRAAFIVDGASYFAAIREAIIEARRSIWIVGWDIESRVRLVRDDDSDQDGWPRELGELLLEALERRRDLEVYVLAWNFSMIYALERDWIPLFSLAFSKHERLHLHLDGAHPVGASHHQKIVVVDDAVAFVGGMDLSKWRWDTSEHRASDPRRTDPCGKSYPPYHDVQVAVDGAAARRLGELVRARWDASTAALSLPEIVPSGDPWPRSICPDLEDVEVGIARTTPSFSGREEVREVERLYVDAIAAARRTIYIENQYLTSRTIVDALIRRLEENDGPEIVIVLPERTGGWLEQTTMDVLRARLLKKLRGADESGHARVYSPRIPGLADEVLSVHSKLMIVDDTLVRVGSANLSNRSMGLDTECDVVFEAGGGERVSRAIAGLRNRLLAEHLGRDADEISARAEDGGSLIGLIEELRGSERTLAELVGSVSEELDRQVPGVVDPEGPMEAADFVERFVGDGQVDRAGRRAWSIAVALVVFGALALAWRFTPLSEWLDTESIADFLSQVSTGPEGALIAIAGIVVGTCLAVPLSFLIIVVALVFGPWWGSAYAYAGGWIACAATYGLGWVLGRDTIARLAGGKLNDLSRRLARQGVLAIVILRMLPVAPAVIVNMVAGASHIRWSDFAIGSAIGLVPGVLAITLFADGLYRAVRQPGVVSWGILAATLLVVGAGGYLLRRWLRRKA